MSNRSRSKMQQSATPGNKTTEAILTPKQLNAASLVAGGSSDDLIAGQLGIDRSTVWRWRTRSPWFQAEVNRHRKALNAIIGDKLRDAMLTALGTVSDIATKSADESLKLKAAMSLLNLVPLSLSCGPTDPREIVRPLAEQQQSDLRDVGRTVIHSIDETEPVITLIDKMLDELESSPEVNEAPPG